MKIRFTLDVAPLDDIAVGPRARLKYTNQFDDICLTIDIIGAMLERHVPRGHRITQVSVEQEDTPDGAATIDGLKPLK